MSTTSCTFGTNDISDECMHLDTISTTSDSDAVEEGGKTVSSGKMKNSPPPSSEDDIATQYYVRRSSSPFTFLTKTSKDDTSVDQSTDGRELISSKEEKIAKTSSPYPDAARMRDRLYSHVVVAVVILLLWGGILIGVSFYQSGDNDNRLNSVELANGLVEDNDASQLPSQLPSQWSSQLPSQWPSQWPSVKPTTSLVPSTFPSTMPSAFPSAFPSNTPSSLPSFLPSMVPTTLPSEAPSTTPSMTPTNLPTATPSIAPTTAPTVVPTSIPSGLPSIVPTYTQSPSTTPTRLPSNPPSMEPTTPPSSLSSASPSTLPSITPSMGPTTPPSSLSSASPSTSPTNRKITNADFSKTNSDFIVGVFYYPWYGNKDFNGRNYLRAEITPPQLPALGEYDQRDPMVISSHLELSRQANINLWVTSWWGPGTSTDRNTISIMKNKDLPGTKIALFYETKGRRHGRIPNGNTKFVYNDIAYAAQTYFNDPNYFKINGCPVFYIYLARDVDDRGKLVEAANLMRQAASDNGHCIYLVGDVAHGTPREAGYKPFDALDAITEYDVFGSMDRPRYAEQSGVDWFREKQSRWRTNAIDNGCAFIPTVTPGYNEKGVRPRLNPMSRKLTAGSDFGSLFQALLTSAVELTDPSTGDIIMVNSWNEWHEDTQIEPVVGTGITQSPNSKTVGLEYEAYGNRYLNILAALTNRE